MSRPEPAHDRDGADAEALRRRLYLPGASAQDLERFEAATSAAQVGSAVGAGTGAGGPAAAPSSASSSWPSGASSDPAHPLPRRAVRSLPSRRVLLAGGGALVVAGAAAVIGVAVRGRAPEVVGPAAEDLGLNGQDRDELLANLRRGGAAGIGAYLVTHRSPPALAATTRLFTVERHGSGPSAAALTVPEEVGGEAGRATVLVTASQAGPVSWRILRLGTAGSPAVRLLPLLARGGDQAAGALTTATVGYAEGRRPVRIEVDVPEGVRWGAAVVYSD